MVGSPSIETSLGRVPFPVNNALVVSGNEITDALRALGVEGDGLSADSSYGIWEATTNYFVNGGVESNLNNWSFFQSTYSRETAAALFGSYGLQITKTAGQAGEARADTGAIMTPGVTACFSVFAKFSDGTLVTNANVTARWADDVANTTGDFTTIQDMGNGWYRCIKTGLIVQDPEALLLCGIRLLDETKTLYLDGMQIEEQPVATPYVETDGATASRSVARVQARASLIDETQSWVAIRMRMNYDSADDPVTDPGYFSWGLDSSNGFQVYYSNSDNQFIIRRLNGGAVDAADGVATFVQGDLITLICVWDSLQVGVSVDGSAFVRSGNGDIPTLVETLFDIGQDVLGGGVGGRLCDSDILWFVCGTGTLTDADAVAIDALGNTDPAPANFPAAAQLTAIWSADNDTYQTYLTSSGSRISLEITLARLNGQNRGVSAEFSAAQLAGGFKRLSLERSLSSMVGLRHVSKEFAAKLLRQQGLP